MYNHHQGPPQGNQAPPNPMAGGHPQYQQRPQQQQPPLPQQPQQTPLPLQPQLSPQYPQQHPQQQFHHNLQQQHSFSSQNAPPPQQAPYGQQPQQQMVGARQPPQPINQTPQHLGPPNAATLHRQPSREAMNMGMNNLAAGVGQMHLGQHVPPPGYPAQQAPSPPAASQGPPPPSKKRPQRVYPDMDNRQGNQGIPQMNQQHHLQQHQQGMPMPPAGINQQHQPQQFPLQQNRNIVPPTQSSPHSPPVPQSQMQSPIPPQYVQQHQQHPQQPLQRQPTQPVQSPQASPVASTQHPYADAPPPGPQPVNTAEPIRQPPHTEGRPLPGPRARINDEAMPSAVLVREEDQAKAQLEPFLTCSETSTPLATTDFIAVDQGNSNPRFMRATTYSMPVSDDIANQASLPLGLVIQPFAKLKPEEGQVPVVDFQSTGPPRCSRCRGYINPWCNFIDGGQRFVCNLCGEVTEVAPEYFSHLDISGRRTDLESRPELCRGTVDFKVSEDYWAVDEPRLSTANTAGSSVLTSSTLTTNSSSQESKATPRPPAPFNRIFAIDVSFHSVQHGIVAEAARSIRQVLYGSPDNDDKDEKQSSPLPPGTKIAIMTFDRTMHFYNLHHELEQPQMLVVGDIEDMFIPLSQGFLVDANESRSVIENLLDSMATMFAKNTTIESLLGGVVGASMSALRTLGGQLNIFLNSLPTSGPGALKHREDSRLYGTDKEKTLFSLQNQYYRQMAEEFSEAGICVNLFLFPSQYIDVASIGVLSGLTGGDTFFFARFDPVRDRERVTSAVSQVLSRQCAYHAMLRIRCSNGLRITDHFGNFFQRNVTDLEFGGIDADKAIAARIRHEGKLSEKGDVYFQCAILYTSDTGERRVRTHNLGIRVTKLVQDVFSLACLETIIAYTAKEAISNATTKSLREVREEITEKCVKALWSYRKYCSKQVIPGQLLLPEGIKLYPLYALCLIKTKALRGGSLVSDVRTHYMRLIKSLGVSQIIHFIYPNMYAVHEFTRDVGMPGIDDRLIMPRRMRASHTRMYAHGVYFIENGEFGVIWIGSHASPELVNDIYGSDARSLDIRMNSLPKLESHVSKQLRNMVNHISSERSERILPIAFARQNLDGTEIEFANMLVEDSNNDGYSYSDYLCFVHKLIQDEMKSERYDEPDTGSHWQSTW